MAFGALVALLATQRIDVAAALTAVAMQQLGARLTMITAAFGRLIESGMFIDDYKTFLRLSEKQMRSSKKMNEQLPRFTGLKVEGVSFAYPNAATPTLEDVSLEIAPGEIVALVGENSSGKTTLVKLICQLYRPAGGQILWSGVDAASLEPESVQSEISVLFQDFIQYHLTALDNIAFGRIDEPALRGDAVAAAARARADDFLSDLPKSYDTRLGLQFFGGHELSVGQWQRLALARVFFRGGDFLILDEPTAAVDPRAERELFARMHALSAGRAVLLISHRFSSVRTADRIYVLRDGRVAEAGTHSDLISANAHYAELFNLSSDSEQLAEGVAPDQTIPACRTRPFRLVRDGKLTYFLHYQRLTARRRSDMASEYERPQLFIVGGFRDLTLASGNDGTTLAGSTIRAGCSNKPELRTSSRARRT